MFDSQLRHFVCFETKNGKVVCPISSRDLEILHKIFSNEIWAMPSAFTVFDGVLSEDGSAIVQSANEEKFVIAVAATPEGLNADETIIDADFKILSKPGYVWKSFVSYEYSADLYDTRSALLPIEERDPVHIKAALDQNAARDDDFIVFDALVPEKAESVDKSDMIQTRNVQPHVMAFSVISAESFKSTLPQCLNIMRQERTGVADRLMTYFNEHGNLNLKGLFRAAVDWKRPVMDWYIREVEVALEDVDKIGATHIAACGDTSLPTYRAMKSGVIAVNKDLTVIPRLG